MSKRRKFNAAFKAKVAREALKEQKTLLDLSQEFQISPSQIAKWKGQVLDSLPQVFENGPKQTKDSDIDVELLYSQIGKLKMQLDFLKKKTGVDFE